MTSKSNLNKKDWQSINDKHEPNTHVSACECVTSRIQSLINQEGIVDVMAERVVDVVAERVAEVMAGCFSIGSNIRHPEKNRISAS